MIYLTPFSVPLDEYESKENQNIPKPIVVRHLGFSTISDIYTKI